MDHHFCVKPSSELQAEFLHKALLRNGNFNELLGTLWLAAIPKWLSSQQLLWVNNLIKTAERKFLLGRMFLHVL